MLLHELMNMRGFYRVPSFWGVKQGGFSGSNARSFGLSTDKNDFRISEEPKPNAAIAMTVF